MDGNLPLSDHCVVVTGGASGIGAATVQALTAQGSHVVIADIQQEAGIALAESLGPRALFCKTDVTREEDIVAAITTAERHFGPITGWVNSAGVIGAVGSIMETTVTAFDQTMAVLCRSVFLGIKHAATAMKAHGGGAIVSVSSIAGLMGGLGPHTYTMAKHGVIGLTRSAASELSALGIRVNAVAPGGTVTPMTAALTGGDSALISEAIRSASPLGIACMPEDIAGGILYLLSDAARNVTGHTLTIDAGITTCTPQMGFHTDSPQVLLHAGQRSDQEPQQA
ncbi:SDR family oxidoreductase [Microbulbifer sp. SA54]|uniref:SDR family oxidoreductase n=1 Tax=Microbulbifer sp. SA54 TaxID=3401577 RepID=UPI003AAAEF79